MFSQLRPALSLFAILMLVTGVAYPFLMTGVAQAVFPAQANGSLIVTDGQVRGSGLIGQAFVNNRYFWPRISAAGAGYDAGASSGANLGPTSKKLIDRVAADAERIKTANGVTSLPPDAATASASGLDPDISPVYALQQVGRVAKARNLAEDKVKALVESHIERPALGIFGEPRVNVLSLNIALDALDHDELGLNQSKLINVIDSFILARDSREKPVPTFSHPAHAPDRTYEAHGTKP